MTHPAKYVVTLSEAERARLTDISRNGGTPAKKILHARILFLADQGPQEGGWTDEQIAEALGLHPYTNCVYQCYRCQPETLVQSRV